MDIMTGACRCLVVLAKVSFVALYCSGCIVLVVHSVSCGAFRKEPQQYVSLFRHCPSPNKRPWELAYFNNRTCAAPSSSRLVQQEWQDAH